MSMEIKNILAAAIESGELDLESAAQFESRWREKNKKYKGEYGSVHTERWLSKFVTQDEDMIQLKNFVRVLVAYDEPVLILGESGTGKELIAKALHGARTGEFIPINCTGLPEQLIETELFGHVKGAFTGAVADKPGLIEQAADGTVFMDEIGDMPIALQAKLLRILEDMKARRIGSNVEYNINCRFIFATNKNPVDVIREDLYFRINTYELKLKSLKERGVDEVILICNSIDPEWQADKEDIAFPDGNVRGLQRMIYRSKLEKEVKALFDGTKLAR